MEFIWFGLFGYIVPMLLGLLVIRANNHIKQRSWRDDNNFVFCPVFNCLLYITIHFYIFNYEKTRD